jgi:abequosyltransferase
LFAFSDFMRQFDKLLTIAIPTYNRSEYLDKCLAHFMSQLAGYENNIELLVSNNASTDNTDAVVNKYREQYPISYFTNDENGGADFNIVRCFEKSKGKFVWIFGDDDFLLPNTLSSVVNLLDTGNGGVGVIHLEKYWFDTDASPVLTDFSYTEYLHPLNFLDTINWWITFITGNIINKSILSDFSGIQAFKNTSLIQLAWTLPAIFAGSKNIKIDSPVVACKSNNTGGYKFYKVFGTNFDMVLDFFIAKGYDKKIKSIIHRHLLSSFFPMFINENDNSFNKSAYVKEEPLVVLLPLYWRYPQFWRRIAPVLVKNKVRAVVRGLK